MDGKVTVVTGGARGIGKGCVEFFAKNGSKVVFCDVRDEVGKETEKEVNRAYPDKVLFVHADVKNEDHIKNLLKTTVERFGRIDCLINNAGFHNPYELIDTLSKEDFYKTLDLNLVAPFMLCKCALPELRKTSGSIVNIASMSGVLGEAGSISYTIAKGGISAMSRALAIDEAKNGVRVNTVSPGPIYTPLFEETMATFENPSEVTETLQNCSLLSRVGTVEEVARCCYFLAVDATFSTGEELKPCGGADVGYGIKPQLK